MRRHENWRNLCLRCFVIMLLWAKTCSVQILFQFTFADKVMTESRRKSAHSSSESLNYQKDHKQTAEVRGFINKLLVDIKKVYNFHPEIKWMNEKPKCRKAYEPTEVIESINLKIDIFFSHHLQRKHSSPHSYQQPVCLWHWPLLNVVYCRLST